MKPFVFQKKWRMLFALFILAMNISVINAIPNGLETMITNERAESAFAEALLHPESLPLTFTQSTNYPWVVDNGFVRSSNSERDNTSSYFFTVVDSEKGLKISFDWYVSSEAGYDFFNFWCDDLQVLHYSGTQFTEFTTSSFHLPAGVHTLKWEYTKDGSINLGEDVAHLRQLKVVNEPYDPRYDFIINEDNVVTGYIGMGGNISIPVGVKAIGNNAFQYNQTITSVTIPNSVTSIGDRAFAYCSKLQDITVGWTTPLPISSSVFEGVNKRNCTLHVPVGSENAYLAANVWKYFLNNSDFEINDGGTLVAYYGDGGNVVIPDGVTTIGYGVFEQNSTITSVTIPTSVTSIGNDAFRDCNSLTSITIPTSVTSIGSGAFAYCSKLQDITVKWTTPLPISSDVFEGVNKRKCTLHVPESSLATYQAANVWKSFFVNSDFEIENGVLVAYYGDGGNVVIPDGVTTIGYGVFEQNSTITSVIIPNSVTSIEDWAFNSCYSLNSVSIPNSVTNIGDHAFEWCYYLRVIAVEWTTPLPISSDVFRGVDKARCTLRVPEGFSEIYQTTDVWKEFLIIDYDFEIENGALIAYLGAGGDVVIPDGVTSIGYRAFYDCSGLTSVTIPNSVTSIGVYAFAYCSGLTSVTIPNSVTSIGEYAFSDCAKLQDITLEWSTPLPISYSVFRRVNKRTCTLHVPENSLAAYQTADVWKGFFIDSDFEIENGVLIGYYGSGGNVVIPNSVTSIGTEAFAYCFDLTSVTIPNSVTSIGTEAFGWCFNLISVTIGNSVTNIEYGAFYSCYSLNSVSIPNLVTYIGSDAFAFCTMLTSMTIPNSVTSIGANVFFYCSSLTSISVDVENQNYASENGVLFNKDKTILIVYPGGKSGAYSIPNSVTSIEYYAFGYCSGLTSVDIPNSVTSIGDRAFYDCTALTSITIPSSVTSIGDYAFIWCDRLTSVTVEWTTPLFISSGVFGYINLSACILHVPAGTKALYEVAEVWKNFGTIIENSNQAINLIDQEQIFVSVKDDYIFINSPVAEKINIYSGNGSLLYSTEKPAGAANFNISHIQNKILIIRGSSGWVRKTMK